MDRCKYINQCYYRIRRTSAACVSGFYNALLTASWYRIAYMANGAIFLSSYAVFSWQTATLHCGVQYHVILCGLAYVAYMYVASFARLLSFIFPIKRCSFCPRCTFTPFSASPNSLLRTLLLRTFIRRVKWRRRICDHDTFAILWVYLGIMCGSS